MKGLSCLALFAITACAHSPHCIADTGRPAYPTRFGVARLIPDTTLGFLRVTVREEGEGPLSGPVHSDLIWSDSARAHFDRDSFDVRVPAGPLRVSVRAGDYRPVDTTVIVHSERGARMRVALPPLISGGRPPLTICRP